jgi:hypothetical protein
MAWAGKSLSGEYVTCPDTPDDVARPRHGNLKPPVPLRVSRWRPGACNDTVEQQLVGRSGHPGNDWRADREVRFAVAEPDSLLLVPTGRLLGFLGLRFPAPDDEHLCVCQDDPPDPDMGHSIARARSPRHGCSCACLAGAAHTQTDEGTASHGRSSAAPRPGCAWSGARTRRSAVPRPPPGGQGSTPCQPTRGVTGRARAPCRGPTDCSIDGEGPAACPRWWCPQLRAVAILSRRRHRLRAVSQCSTRALTTRRSTTRAHPKLRSGLADASPPAMHPPRPASPPAAPLHPRQRQPRRSAPLRSASRHTVAPKGACFAISLSMLSIRTRFRPLVQRPQRPLPCSA